MSSLEDTEIEEIKDLYNTFKKELKNDIENKTISKRKECYLIKNSWDLELNNNFKNYNRKFTNNNITFNLPSNSPEFINDIEATINSIKSGEKLNLQNPNLIDYIDRKNKFNYKRSMNYLAGNSKIILEYKYNDKILLIENAYSVPEGISNLMKKLKKR